MTPPTRRDTALHSDQDLAELQSRLDQVSAEMIDLIRSYELDATSPFDVIAVAREKITRPEDYIRFLELSLEGRILGEAASALMKTEDSP